MMSTQGTIKLGEKGFTRQKQIEKERFGLVQELAAHMSTYQ